MGRWWEDAGGDWGCMHYNQARSHTSISQREIMYVCLDMMGKQWLFKNAYYVPDEVSVSVRPNRARWEPF